ncbi:MAG: glutaminase A [Coleofasciculus sp. B1-GNL1-01]|uniref:glutaminase A n=1 Tax=Coleofasciculus sp. B1-GNL1-01 TaxID=3068484 RepID=UPI0032F31B57
MAEKIETSHPISDRDNPNHHQSSLGLSALTSDQLNTLIAQAKVKCQGGQLPTYIPLLAQANPGWVAIQVQRIKGEGVAAGDIRCSFPLMSVIKPFVLLFLLEQLGTEAVFSQVGMEPSDQPFNSLAQLQADRGKPRNPMINSGAIALAGRLPGKDGASRCESLRQWLNQRSQSQLVLDEAMLQSVRSLPNERNQAIAHLLATAGYLDCPEIALDTYNHVCCLSGTVTDLANLGMLLAQDSSMISPQHRRTVNDILITCGLYQASSRFATEVGLPTKSGVSGAIVSIVPSQGAIACYSPALDERGNSQAGLFIVQQLAQDLQLDMVS